MKINNQYITVGFLLGTIALLSLCLYKVSSTKENLQSPKICQNFKQSCDNANPCCTNKNLQCVDGTCASA